MFVVWEVVQAPDTHLPCQKCFFPVPAPLILPLLYPQNQADIWIGLVGCSFELF